jgi:hypothetical protein
LFTTKRVLIRDKGGATGKRILWVALYILDLLYLSS